MTDAPSFKISRPEDFTPEEAIVQLNRRNAAGEPLVVKIRALSKAKMGALFGGLPSAPIGDQGEQIAPLAAEVVKEREAETLKRWRAVMREAAVEPRLRFDGDPEDADALLWSNLDEYTQRAYFNAILVHSGFALPAEAEEMLSFRIVERGGVAVGG